MPFDSPNIMTVHLDKLREAAHVAKSELNTDSLIAVIKADAYGLGAIEVARSIQSKVDILAVATLSEAAELRDASIMTPILLLAEPPISNLEKSLDLDLIYTIYTEACRTSLSSFASAANMTIPVHIKVDTGMTRLGVSMDDAIHYIQDVLTTPNLSVDGLYTHLSCADQPENPENKSQLNRWTTLLNELTSQGISISNTHICNSGGSRLFPEQCRQAVRLGLRLVEDAVTLSSELRLIRFVPAGTPVSYGGLYTPAEDTRIGLIPMGYADGIPSQYQSGRAWINGKNVPIVGQVCMDMIMVDLGLTDHYLTGDSAILLSPSGTDGPSLMDIIERSNQNPRELLIRFGQAKRVKTHYSE